jgi:DNA (cytosine-5)-methyltransferase 1
MTNQAREERLTIGSLFSGIGGLDLGLERGLALGGVSSRVLWQVEQSEWCRSVLARHWPDATRYDDVCAVGADLAPVDVVIGGFPCQDISTAGNQAGIATNTRSGLFYELTRIARILRPRYLMLENVSAITASGDGGDLSAVLGELAALGYDAWWDCIPAAAVGAPHRRDRWFLVGWLADDGRVHLQHGGAAGEAGRATRAGQGVVELSGQRLRDAARGGCEDVSDSSSVGSQGVIEARTAARAALGNRGWGYLEPGVGGTADGVPAGVDGPVSPRPWQPWEGDTPRTAPRTETTRHRLRALGNAVVPQVAEVIGSYLAALHTTR